MRVAALHGPPGHDVKLLRFALEAVESAGFIKLKLLAKLGLEAHEAGFMGDDVIDLQVMDHCGFSAAPANAHALAKQYARLVTEHTGGFGAAREVCEFILEAQGKLDAALAPYLPQSHSAAEK